MSYICWALHTWLWEPADQGNTAEHGRLLINATCSMLMFQAAKQSVPLEMRPLSARTGALEGLLLPCKADLASTSSIVQHHNTLGTHVAASLRLHPGVKLAMPRPPLLWVQPPLARSLPFSAGLPVRRDDGEPWDIAEQQGIASYCWQEGMPRQCAAPGKDCRWQALQGASAAAPGGAWHCLLIQPRASVQLPGSQVADCRCVQAAFLRSQGRASARREVSTNAANVAAVSIGDAPEEKKFLGISSFTWSKILPLGLMFFCILFNYTILRDTKVHTWPDVMLYLL